ncbi:hypothetical protein [Vibrio barjaei]|uniref:hypothetical protein n=1 Tax=Vibrio barjaei TaxID=1676683 RepID=UPI002284C815|nr:hypothetical protein [Vibrio barjaei]MCY9874064.1 hypothetical protein [Vibrio barjaei]
MERLELFEGLEDCAPSMGWRRDLVSVVDAVEGVDGAVAALAPMSNLSAGQTVVVMLTLYNFLHQEYHRADADFFVHDVVSEAEEVTDEKVEAIVDAVEVVHPEFMDCIARAECDKALFGALCVLGLMRVYCTDEWYGKASPLIIKRHGVHADGAGGYLVNGVPVSGKAFTK